MRVSLLSFTYLYLVACSGGSTDPIPRGHPMPVDMAATDGSPMDPGPSDGGAVAMDVSPRDAGMADAAVPTLDTGAMPDVHGDAGSPDALSDAETDAAEVDGDPPRACPEIQGPPMDAPPAVIVLMGDGMGSTHLRAASLALHGVPDGLVLQNAFAHHGWLRTASLGGVTDSGASATAMGCGIKTWNYTVGVDRRGEPCGNVIELAHQQGMRTGIVTTAELVDATVAGFAAHHRNRYSEIELAAQLAQVRPAVMLGGGRAYFRGPGPAETNQIQRLVDAGYQLATTTEELLGLEPRCGLLGLFYDIALDLIAHRGPDSAQPTLTQMTRAALTALEPSPRGFFLLVEDEGIDTASHRNDFASVIPEIGQLDDAVAEVVAWAAGRENTTIIVLSDHETGDLTLVDDTPQVSWGRLSHSNQLVHIYGSGPGADIFADRTLDNRWVHSLLVSRITGEEPTAPTVQAVPDGALADLEHLAAGQQVVTGFGEGYNQLDALHLHVGEVGLSVGLAGVFEQGENALVLLLDVDFGDGTGPARLQGALSDRQGRLDNLLTNLPLDAPVVPGFGADLALGVIDAQDTPFEYLADGAGLRGLRPPYGQPDDLGWYPVSLNFSQAVISRGDPVAPQAGEGFEALIPWSVLYPDGDGVVTPGATIAVVAILVNGTGEFVSNQCLPAFPPGTANPGGGGVALPGLVLLDIDVDRDGVPDGHQPPRVVPMP